LPNNSGAYLFDVSQPVAVFGIFALYDVEVTLLNLGGNRAALADADLAAVDFANRRNFGGSAGEEYLVGYIQFIARQAFFVFLPSPLHFTAVSH